MFQRKSNKMCVDFYSNLSFRLTPAFFSRYRTETEVTFFLSNTIQPSNRCIILFDQMYIDLCYILAKYCSMMTHVLFISDKQTILGTSIQQQFAPLLLRHEVPPMSLDINIISTHFRFPIKIFSVNKRQKYLAPCPSFSNTSKILNLFSSQSEITSFPS